MQCLMKNCKRPISFIEGLADLGSTIRRKGLFIFGSPDSWPSPDWSERGQE